MGATNADSRVCYLQLPGPIYETRQLKDSKGEQWQCPTGRTLVSCTLPHLGLQITPCEGPFILLSQRFRSLLCASVP